MTQTNHRIPVPGGGLHALHSGEGDTAIVMLHGWPQTCREWSAVTELLSDQHQIITPDLRGCGDSFKPMTGYDAVTQASDVLALLDHFDVKQAHLVGHDVGGPVAYAFAASHRSRCASLSLIEAPLWGVVGDDVPDLLSMFWHLQFHQDVDLAERLIRGDIAAYLEHFYRDFGYNPDAISPAEVAEYVRAYSVIGALRASLMHYHAIPQTAEQLKELSTDKLTMPVAAYGSEMVMSGYCEAAAALVAEDVTGGIIPACGHWVPEEKPQAVADIITASITAASA